MGILNDIVPDKVGGGVKQGQGNQLDLDGAKQSLDLSALKLLIQEIEYDEKCMNAYSSRMMQYQVRLAHQKNEWITKRIENAKTSVNRWMDSKALIYDIKIKHHDVSANGLVIQPGQHHIIMGPWIGAGIELARKDWWCRSYQCCAAAGRHCHQMVPITAAPDNRP